MKKQYDTIKPFTAGVTCSAFAPNATAAYESYCNGGVGICNKICYNFGTLNKKTCTCQCKGLATGPQCETLICDKTDVQYGCPYPGDLTSCTYPDEIPLW